MLIKSVDFVLLVSLDLQRTCKITRPVLSCVQGEAVIQQPGDTAAPSSATTVVFGLFEGRKTRSRGAACTRTIQCNYHDLVTTAEYLK